jgi:hypothetical protein
MQTKLNELESAQPYDWSARSLRAYEPKASKKFCVHTSLNNVKTFRRALHAFARKLRAPKVV